MHVISEDFAETGHMLRLVCAFATDQKALAQFVFLSGPSHQTSVLFA